MGYPNAAQEAHGAADWSLNNQRARQCVVDLLLDCSAESEDSFHRLKGCCESPIEGIALAGLLALLPSALAVAKTDDLKDRIGWTLAIVPQVRRCGYRLDFVVYDRTRGLTFGLQCDGRDYHLDHRRDCARSIALWNDNVIVERVTGYSLCFNPRAALAPFARKVMGNDMRLAWRLSESSLPLPVNQGMDAAALSA